MVKRRAIGNQPVALNAPITRFKAYDTAEIGRLAYRTAGIATQAYHTQARLYGYGRAPGRTAGYPALVGSIERIAVKRILVAGAHGKLIAIAVADDDGLFVEQALDGGGVVAGGKTFEDMRGGGDLMSFITEYVLDAYHYTVQPAGGPARSSCGIQLTGPLQGLGGIDFHEGVQALIGFGLLQKKLNGGYAGGSAIE